MSSTAASQRIDTLLALALTGGGRREARDEVEYRGGAGTPEGALDLLPGLDASSRSAFESRAASFAKLSPEQQASWLAQTLRRSSSSEDESRLDEHVHPTHIVEVLREEPVPMQSLMLRGLPRRMAEQVALMLNLKLPASGSDDESERPVNVAPEILGVLRRAFLSRFVSLEQLTKSTALDLLSGVELRRLVKFLGAREVAHACLRVPVEDVGLFLRRFPAEDARVVATHMAARPKLSVPRAAFAARLMDMAVSVESVPEAMLNHLGLKLLALALVESSATRIRYTAQKIPFEAAGSLRELVAASRDADEPEMIRAITEEAEALAASLHQPPTRAAQPAGTPARSDSQTFAETKK